MRRSALFQYMPPMPRTFDDGTSAYGLASAIVPSQLDSSDAGTVLLVPPLQAKAIGPRSLNGATRSCCMSMFTVRHKRSYPCDLAVNRSAGGHAGEGHPGAGVVTNR